MSSTESRVPGAICSATVCAKRAGPVGLISSFFRVREFFSGTPNDFFARNRREPFLVEYEKLCENYEATIRATFSYLRIKLPRGKKINAPLTKKQSDAISAEWERLYRESNMI